MADTREIPDTDGALLWVLRHAADEWGARGVVLTALRLWPDAVPELDFRPLHGPPPVDEDDGDSNLVAHARHELELLGEDRDVIDWYVRVVKAFASFGHSGGSAMATIPVLHDLFQYRALTPLTDDPDEWIDHTDASGGHPMWQNRRQSEAFSEDGGVTYYLLSEREAAGSLESTPLHRSVEREATDG